MGETYITIWGVTACGAGGERGGPGACSVGEASDIEETLTCRPNSAKIDISSRYAEARKATGRMCPVGVIMRLDHALAHRHALLKRSQHS